MVGRVAALIVWVKDQLRNRHRKLSKRASGHVVRAEPSAPLLLDGDAPSWHVTLSIFLLPVIALKKCHVSLISQANVRPVTPEVARLTQYYFSHEQSELQLLQSEHRCRYRAWSTLSIDSYYIGRVIRSAEHRVVQQLVLVFSCVQRAQIEIQKPFTLDGFATCCWRSNRSPREAVASCSMCRRGISSLRRQVR
jgi:hypothetical protein